MDEKLIDKLLSIINDIVNADGAYADKVSQIRSVAVADDLDGDLDEFLSWFED